MLEVVDLTVSYGPVEAVRELSLYVLKCLVVSLLVI